MRLGWHFDAQCDSIAPVYCPAGTNLNRSVLWFDAWYTGARLGQQLEFGCGVFCSVGFPFLFLQLVPRAAPAVLVAAV